MNQGKTVKVRLWGKMSQYIENRKFHECWQKYKKTLAKLKEKQDIMAYLLETTYSTKEEVAREVQGIRDFY